MSSGRESGFSKKPVKSFLGSAICFSGCPLILRTGYMACNFGSSKMYPPSQGSCDSLGRIFAIMAKSLAKPPETFGARLRRFRATSGFTLEQLGRKVGLSKRMVAYYEIQGGTPSPEQLAAFAKALGISADQLVGTAGAQAVDAPRGGGEMRLWRRLRQIQQLPEDQRRAVLKVLDGLLGRVHSDAA